MGSFADKEQSRKKKSVVSAIAGVNKEEQIKEQESIETLEKGQLVQPSPKTERKRAGRPKLQNRELRKRYSFTMLPSLHEKVQEKASIEGKTLSELINDFLSKYVE